MANLPRWMRAALITSAALNMVGAATFLPRSEALRRLGGLPVGSHALYLSVIATFTAIFGVGYLWLGLTGRDDPPFIAAGAVAKLAFAALIAGFCWARQLPPRAAIWGAGDLMLGATFVSWLWTARASRSRRAAHDA
ncbi:MAG: hypothetical protein ABIW19_16925 [Vicinamibacterales bacterium]